MCLVKMAPSPSVRHWLEWASEMACLLNVHESKLYIEENIVSCHHSQDDFEVDKENEREFIIKSVYLYLYMRGTFLFVFFVGIMWCVCVVNIFIYQYLF